MNPILSMLAFRAEGELNAIEIKLKEGWHIYWENPGDTGMATQLESEGELLFPVPTLITQSGGLRAYGFEHEVVLFVAKAPENAEIVLRWLACTDENCIPGYTALSVQKDERNWRAAKARLPVPFSGEMVDSRGKSVLFLEGVTQLFPSAETEQMIEKWEYVQSGVQIYWNSEKPKHGTLIVQRNNDKMAYKVVW